jgi:hypothetical protein
MMNLKTVKLILKRKHNDFLKSIDDEKVRKRFHNHSIITGGSIASLLLNEKVNDFDYYLTDLETCYMVAEYYVKKFKELNPDCEPAPRVSVEDDRVRIHIQSRGIAGEEDEETGTGFEIDPVMDEVLQDIETSDEIPGELLDEVNKDEKKKLKYQPVFMTSNAITLSDKVQIIIRFHGSPEEIHKNYDFIHCTNYWVPKDNKLVLNQKALESLITKNLYYVGSLYPLCSILRIRKFIKKGWTINAGQLIKVMWQISELDLKNLDVLEEQLIGVDSAYFNEVINYLRDRMEKDPDFKLDGAYLSTVLDRIFGT